MAVRSFSRAWQRIGVWGRGARRSEAVFPLPECEPASRTVGSGHRGRAGSRTGAYVTDISSKADKTSTSAGTARRATLPQTAFFYHDLENERAKPPFVAATRKTNGRGLPINAAARGVKCGKRPKQRHGIPYPQRGRQFEMPGARGLCAGDGWAACRQGLLPRRSLVGNAPLAQREYLPNLYEQDKRSPEKSDRSRGAPLLA